jgi:hypothetical protein
VIRLIAIGENMVNIAEAKAIIAFNPWVSFPNISIFDNNPNTITYTNRKVNILPKLARSPPSKSVTIFLPNY